MLRQITDPDGQRMRRTLAAALLASTALVAVPAAAQDATWSPNPVSNEFENAANWVGGSVPTGTATFGASTVTGIQSYLSHTMAGWTFAASHTGFGISSFAALTFTGAGISNAGSGVGFNAFGALTFRNASATTGIHINSFNLTEFLDTSRAGGTIHAFATLNFRDSSSAGAAYITNFGAVSFSGTSSAGTATIVNVNSGTSTTFGGSTTAGSATIISSFGGTTTFNDSSSAGSARIESIYASALTFNNSSTAGTATIINWDGGITTFNDSSSAGSATIYGLLNSSLSFNDSSTAASATISGSGTIQFTDSSSAGSATITNSGTMRFSGSSTAGTSTIATSNSLTFHDTATAGSAIITNARDSNLVFYDSSTAGSATITNSGALSFHNTSTAGSASINSGSSLSFFHNSSAGSSIVTNSSVTSFFHNSTAATAAITNSGILNFWDAATAGSSTITNTGSGALTFLATSTAGGATIVNNGFIRFDHASSAGSAAITNDSFIHFLGGSSAGSATINNRYGVSFFGTSTAGSAAITSTSTLFFNDGSTAGSASITNSGSLRFYDASTAGTATITSSNYLGFSQSSSTGNATITSTGTFQLATSNETGAATVTVQYGGLLAGYGSVGTTTIQAGAMIMPSGGTLRINGNLTLAPGSFYGACICAQTTVTGTASLGGATLGLPQALFQAQTRTLLTAAGGVSGTFTLAPGTTPFASLIYGANDVTLTIAAYRAGAALAGTGTANTRNVAAGIDRSLDAGATPPSAFNSLLYLYGGALANALDRLHGEAGTGAQSTSFSTASTFLGIMLDPMAGARGATASAPGSSLIEMADTGATPAARVAAGWSVWTKAFGQAGRTASDAATGAAGTATSVFGVAAGADRRISPDTLVGFALAGGGTAFGLGGRGSGTGEYFQLGLYGSTRLGEGYVSAAVSYGWNRFDVSRTAGLGPLETYTSAPVAHTFGGRVEAGRRFGNRALAVTPYAALEAIGYASGSYRETFVPPAAGAFALAYAARTTGTLRTELGLRVDGMRAVAPTADLLTFGRIAYAFQANTQRAADASFQQLANSGFTVFGARASAHTLLATLGTEVRLATGTSATASLDGELGDRHRSIRANLGLRHSW
ncbi:MAG: autotransporter domain-containing protein [Proteobacteria bacterium]|nr:autotransporter domain-containing protein [Pseudomonadota bacterium]